VFPFVDSQPFYNTCLFACFFEAEIGPLLPILDMRTPLETLLETLLAILFKLITTQQFAIYVTTYVCINNSAVASGLLIGRLQGWLWIEWTTSLARWTDGQWPTVIFIPENCETNIKI